jgi:hypothetical protein
MILQNKILTIATASLACVLTNGLLQASDSSSLSSYVLLETEEHVTKRGETKTTYTTYVMPRDDYKRLCRFSSGDEARLDVMQDELDHKVPAEIWITQKCCLRLPKFWESIRLSARAFGSAKKNLLTEFSKVGHGEGSLNEEEFMLAVKHMVVMALSGSAEVKRCDVADCKTSVENLFTVMLTQSELIEFPVWWNECCLTLLKTDFACPLIQAEGKSLDKSYGSFDDDISSISTGMSPRSPLRSIGSIGSDFAHSESGDDDAAAGAGSGEDAGLTEAVSVDETETVDLDAGTDRSLLRRRSSILPRRLSIALSKVFGKK